MLVPRSYKYSSSPTRASLNEKPVRRSSMRRNVEPSTEKALSAQTLSPKRPTTATTEPVNIPNVASPDRTTSETLTEMPTNQRRSQTVNYGRRRQSTTQDPNTLPPAVVALLAGTTIPPRKPGRYRRRPENNRRISIEEVVRDWKSDASLNSSYGSPVLSVLLEDTDCEDCERARKHSVSKPHYLSSRSASSESMPSLDSDDHSILSLGSPSTPGSLRSRKSYQNIKREKSRSFSVVEDCGVDHPLASRVEDDEDDLVFPVQKRRVAAAKPRSSFTSNLTTSLQSLKKAAVGSLSSFARASAASSQSRIASPPIDDMLWSHPFLFPRFSTEIRPILDSAPSEADRRYLNPMPLTFEEQEAPFQQALHAPFLAQTIEDAPTIQLQTYNGRGRKRGNAKRIANPNSEAGRALLGASGTRQREVRENPDFLRIVVMEMNMRREGKLEQGRAKIWLPPRDPSPAPGKSAKIPTRWQGESAYGA